jgi:hypothetical protein
MTNSNEQPLKISKVKIDGGHDGCQLKVLLTLSAALPHKCSGS